MTLPRALFVLLGLTALGGAIGALLGYALGTSFPGYYRGVFPLAAAHPDFDTVAVGLGLGLTQGVILGAILGTILLVVLMWYDLRCRQIAATAASQQREKDSPVDPTAAQGIRNL
jgi:hypothetical protein